jgi:nucleotide-binding universal stress UspA family protein
MIDGYVHIACCVDGSDGSRHALQEAVRVRDLCDARLTLVHALELPQPRVALAEGMARMPNLDDPLQPTRRWLEEEAVAVPGAETVLLGPGHAPSAVCEWAKEADVELLAAGSTHGR